METEIIDEHLEGVVTRGGAQFRRAPGTTVVHNVCHHNGARRPVYVIETPDGVVQILATEIVGFLGPLQAHVPGPRVESLGEVIRPGNPFGSDAFEERQAAFAADEAEAATDRFVREQAKAGVVIDTQALQEAAEIEARNVARAAEYRRRMIEDGVSPATW